VFIQPLAQVVVVGFESKKAFLLGEVQNSGYFPISDKTPILEFIAQRGGFMPRSNLTEVQVTRSNGERIKVNIYDIVLRGVKAQNVAILPEDIVFVPSVESIGKKYFILGEVRQPGLIQTQEDLTLLEAIARAGTLATSAQAKHVFLVRQNAAGESEVKDIRFSDLYTKGDFSRNIPLRNGDIVFVPKNVRTRITDVLTVLTPIISFVRDTIILADIARRKNP
jgi:polysaccharide export outer membrane protein